MSEELKLVVDASQALRKITIVQRMAEALTAVNEMRRRSAIISFELIEAMQNFQAAGGFAALDRELAIVGAETQVGQFVTASPAYGVYDGGEGDPAALARQASITGQRALDGIMTAMDNANADDMRDAKRFRTMCKLATLVAWRDGDHDLNAAEQQALEIIDTIDCDEAMPQDDETAAIIYGIDKIIAAGLLEGL